MRSMIITDIKLPIGKGEEELRKIAEKRLGAKAAHFVVLRKSLDARDKNNLRYVYTVECAGKPQMKKKTEIERIEKGKLPTHPVVVVGSGPAGLFAALRLIERGICPVVLERGAPVEEREKKIESFFQTGRLDTQTNVQFGEGGAGTFSDGKLNTQTHTPLNKEVLETFVRFGAPKEIEYLAKPHVGSDNLKKIVKAMRGYILSKGGKILFSTRLTDFTVKEGRVEEIVAQKEDGGELRFPVSALLLAVGHSARDTFEMLERKGVPMRAKDFAVGVRIEHLQQDIGLAQYGKQYTLLPAAEYKLVSHASVRSVFTFCMCPGGYVMPAASEEGGVVVNGMSNYARDGQNANSALVVQIARSDYADETPLASMRFQREMEQKAFLAGGGRYAAPVQLVGDFLQGRVSSQFGEVLPTYAAGTAFADLKEVLPAAVVDPLKRGLLDMDRRLKGFATPHALLTGVETRTSSPVRIERDEDMQSTGVKGLFPCGEGAGYAGGITSSAADGLRVADSLFALLQKGTL